MKISVALCTYNGEKYINEQIDSILNQSLNVDEIIVCDDRSNDKTLEILENYSKNNPKLFKIYENEVNLRSVKNFEKAIKLCTGDFIFLSDQDDIWIENKVEEYIKYFNENPTIDVLASNGYCIDENGKIHDKYAIWDVPQFLREREIEFDYHTIISFVSNISTGASMAFRKEIIPEIMPFPIIKDFHHDEWIALIASKKQSFELLDKKYFYYRIHDNQQVGSTFYKKTQTKKKYLTDFADHKSTNSRFKVYKKRLKKSAGFYELNKKLIALNVYNKQTFEDNVEKTLLFYKCTIKKIKKKYPVKCFFLNISDNIFNKRKIKFNESIHNYSRF
jgi:glycosyltransferase involved in cell wall biosynthesis